MGTITTLYAIAFACFFTRFQEFLHKHLLYTSSDFSTRFFEDNIQMFKCSRGSVTKHMFMWSLEEMPRKRRTAVAAGHQVCPPTPNHRADPPRPFWGCLACIKTDEWMNKGLQFHYFLCLSNSTRNISLRWPVWDFSSPLWYSDSFSFYLWTFCFPHLLWWVLKATFITSIFKSYSDEQFLFFGPLQIQHKLWIKNSLIFTLIQLILIFNFRWVK
jgi:hypothetical protein